MVASYNPSFEPIRLTLFLMFDFISTQIILRRIESAVGAGFLKHLRGSKNGIILARMTFDKERVVANRD